MADRYWVGGTGSWDATAGTKWAATSGGAGGQPVPTAADAVFFDANSGAVTVSMDSGTALSVDCTGFTGTLSGSATYVISGSFILVAGMTYNRTGQTTFNGTGTLTTAGHTMGVVLINGSGITLTLGSALTSSGAVTTQLGTFDTAGFNVTATNINSNFTSVRQILLRSSTVTVSANTLDFGNATNFTFNAGTSTIICTSSAININAFSGIVFHNVSLTGTGTGVRRINNPNTFNNLTVAPTTAPTASALQLFNNITVNGTFTCAGSGALTRGFVLSSVVGTTRTITAAAISAADCDFRNITIAGAAAGASPTRAGNCGGNSGINFPTAKTVYRVGTNTTWPGSSSWATTSGGTGNDLNFPLPQDTAVIDNNTALTGTLNFADYNISGLNCSTRTTGITISHTVSVTLYGSYILGSGVTLTGTAGPTFAPIGTSTLTTAGITLPFTISILSAATTQGTVQLGSALTLTGLIQLFRGTFTAGANNVTADKFYSDPSSFPAGRTLNMGSGLWTITGWGTSTSAPWYIGNNGNWTVNKETANILFSDNTTNSRAFDGGERAYNKITIGGATSTSTWIVARGDSFTEVASTKTVAWTLLLDPGFGALNTTVFSITGSPGNLVNVTGNSFQRTINIGSVVRNTDYLQVLRIRALPVNRFYVGVNSVDLGTNLNVYFTAAPPLPQGNMFLMF